MLTLLGGKYTTAQAVAEEALHKIYSLAKVRRKVTTLRGRPYPGFVKGQEHLQEFRRRAEERGVPTAITEATIARFGVLVVYMMDIPDWYEVVDGRILRGAIRFVILVEQARNVSGVLRHLSIDKEAPVSGDCQAVILQELEHCGVMCPARES
jgi:glycerol-3-phosphate dehydrogenase